MNESDIYYVDTRNADHRHPGSTPWRPGAPRPVQTVYAQPSRVYTQQQAQPQIIYAQPPQTALASNIFGKVTAGMDVVKKIEGLGSRSGATIWTRWRHRSCPGSGPRPSNQ